MKFFTDMYFLMLAVSGFVSIWRFRRLDPWFLRLVPLAIFLVIAKETGGSLIHGNNSWWFNLFVPFDYAAIALLYYFYFRTKSAMVYTCVSMALVLALSVFLFSTESLNKYTTLLGSILLLPFIFMYYIDLLRRPVPAQLSREPMFWTSSGLLFYHVGSIGLFLALDYYLKTKLSIHAKNCISAMLILCSVMYVFFIVALLCQKKTKPV